MKIYNTKNGKAVYINNEQVLISDDIAKVIEHFESTIDDLNNKSFKSSTSSQILEFAKKYTVEELNKEKDGIKMECVILREGTTILRMRVKRNGVDVSSKILPAAYQGSYENIVNW